MYLEYWFYLKLIGYWIFQRNQISISHWIFGLHLYTYIYYIILYFHFAILQSFATVKTLTAYWICIYNFLGQFYIQYQLLACHINSFLVTFCQTTSDWKYVFSICPRSSSPLSIHLLSTSLIPLPWLSQCQKHTKIHTFCKTKCLFFLIWILTMYPFYTNIEKYWYLSLPLSLSFSLFWSWSLFLSLYLFLYCWRCRGWGEGEGTSENLEDPAKNFIVLILSNWLISLSIKVCISPEEVATATKAWE